MPQTARKPTNIAPARNVLGTELEPCSLDPLTGFFRDCCNTGDHERGLHVVCARMTAEFLEFSGNRGNNLVTPRPEFNFSGLKPGDQWCFTSYPCTPPPLTRRFSGASTRVVGTTFEPSQAGPKGETQGEPHAANASTLTYWLVCSEAR